MRALPALALALLVSLFVVANAASPFVVPPYLQLGEAYAAGTVSIVWHGPRAGESPRVEWRPLSSGAWSPAASAERLEMVDRVVYTVPLPVGRTGEAFRYRLLADGVPVFESGGIAPVGPGRPVRIAVIGDGADGGEDQRALAARMLVRHEERPFAFVLLAGDLAYDCGTRADYDRSFFPIYNADAGSARGVGLMRQVPFVGALGNHDVGDRGWWIFGRCTPDYAYFAFWRHPASALTSLPLTPGRAPRSPGRAFAFPPDTLPQVLARGNFSYTWGDVHVTVLDSNRYVDWSHPALVEWLADDLERARASRWRIVVFHHAPFHFAAAHAGDQWMRALAPVFEKFKVAIVFAGHVHNFQWFGPARFAPDDAAMAALSRGTRGRLAGRADLDAIDPASSEIAATSPIYIVSGAGGHNLEDQPKRCPGNLSPEPANCLDGPPVEGGEPSVTIVDVGPDALAVQQVAASGRVVLSRQIK